jgi:hypothetical protein
MGSSAHKSDCEGRITCVAPGVLKTKWYGKRKTENLEKGFLKIRKRVFQESISREKFR